MISGVLNIYKPRGCTSHDVTKTVRKLLKVKAGHAGTLDPGAEGVLAVCVGTATKMADHLGDEKIYKAELVLGVITDTDDTSGNIIETSGASVSREELERAIEPFAGTTTQIPPMYSAVKMNGVPLYKLARQGKVIERKPREIFISSMEILYYDEKKRTASLMVNCLKGVYIRVLCADIGKNLG